jgi:hypothetical protein
VAHCQKEGLARKSEPATVKILFIGDRPDVAKQIHKMLLRTGVARFETVFYNLNSKDKNCSDKEKAVLILYNPLILDTLDFQTLIALPKHINLPIQKRAFFFKSLTLL